MAGPGRQRDPDEAMHKLVVVLRGAAESEWMERRWSEDFVPLAERMPGLRRVLVGRVRGAPAGPAEVLLLHEFLFDDLASLQAAMTSAEGQAAGLALMRFAGERAELFIAEHQEMSLGRRTRAGGAGGGLLRRRAPGDGPGWAAASGRDGGGVGLSLRLQPHDIVTLEDARGGL